MGLKEARRDLRLDTDADRARLSQRYFRTGPGEYAEGDRFLGLTVPQVRSVARRHRDLTDAALESLLASPWHEERQLALVILVDRMRRAKGAERERVFRFYVDHRNGINNWDLVDVTAPTILGPFLDGPAGPLVEAWSRSSSLWERRLSVLAHHWEIRDGRVDRFLRLAPRFLDDPEDLMHKAVGWTLREVGNVDREALVAFIERYGPRMPRTMLRDAIERMPEPVRRRILATPIVRAKARRPGPAR